MGLKEFLGGAYQNDPSKGALDPVNWDILDLTGANAASTAYQNQQALDEMAWRRSEHSAQNQRDWEERMASTAIQRQVADAEAAGINKMALFGGSVGADTPSGSSASASSGNASMANNKLAAAAGAFALFLRFLITKGK